MVTVHWEESDFTKKRHIGGYEDEEKEDKTF